MPVIVTPQQNPANWEASAHRGESLKVERGTEQWDRILNDIWGSPYGILTENWDIDPLPGAIFRPTRGRWNGEETDGQSVTVATAGNAMRCARHAFHLGEDAVLARFRGEVCLIFADGSIYNATSVEIGPKKQNGTRLPYGAWGEFFFPGLMGKDDKPLAD